MRDRLDAFLLKVLKSFPPLSLQETQGTITWWERARGNDESLIAFLIRQKVLVENANKTLHLMEKGYVQFKDCSSLFTNSALDRIRHQGASVTTRTDCSHTHQPSPPAKQTHQSSATSVPGTATELVQKISGTKNTPHHLNSSELSKTIIAGESEQPQIGVGTLLGKCLLTDVLGEGGGGTVYRAFHNALQILVAVKLLRGAGQPNSKYYQNFRAGARLLAQLNHPSICSRTRL